MVTIRIACRHCGSENIIRNGITSNSKQRFLCKDCAKNSREDPQPNGYTDQKRGEILRAYQERSSLRGLSRTLGVSRNTVTSWLEKVPGAPRAERNAGRARPRRRSGGHHPGTTGRALCSFVLKKAQRRWVWLALAGVVPRDAPGGRLLHRRQERTELPRAVGAGAGGLPRRVLLQRLLEGVSGGSPRRATYGGRQGERRDSACREVEQHFEAAAFSLRAEEPVVLQEGFRGRF